MKDVVYEIITEQELWIKEQLHNSIDVIYSYFLNQSSTFEITVPREIQGGADQALEY